MMTNDERNRLQKSQSDFEAYKQRIWKAAYEFDSGQRTLFLEGSFHENQGFSIFPVQNEVLALHETNIGSRISRRVTVEEATGMLKNPNLTNRDTVAIFLKFIGRKV